MQTNNRRWNLPQPGPLDEPEEDLYTEDGVARVTALPKMRSLSDEEKEALRRRVLGLAKKPEPTE
ncbi:MAG TPA: hypothetical protein VFA07_03150 [Chthonomonadaceae bacterium]|nr:hypothetical protein [Chthonomonadaceae bacterium]